MAIDRRGVLVLFKKARPSISNEDLLQLELDCHKKFAHDLTAHHERVQCFAQLLRRTDEAVDVPAWMNLTLKQISLKMPLSMGDRKMMEEYEQSIKDFNEFVGDQSLIQCPKCKQKTVSWDAKQIRRADEGSTIFCECSSCGKRWKLG